jgi:hypothetical protein
VLVWLDKFEHSVFWLETLVILLFAVFWVVQTRELWVISRMSENKEFVETDNRAHSAGTTGADDQAETEVDETASDVTQPKRA